MDAAMAAWEAEKVRLLDRLAEISVEEQRALGTFKSVPHLCDLEGVSLDLARRLGRTSLSRAVREVAAGCDTQAACPKCRRTSPVEMTRREAKSLSGSIELLEPKAYCPACRRDFFPSA